MDQTSRRQRKETRIRVYGKSRHASVQKPTNQSAQWRSAATRLFSTRLGSKRLHLFYGRTLSRSRCHHRSCHYQYFKRTPKRRQNGNRRASRLTNRSRIFRLGNLFKRSEERRVGKECR